MNTFLYNRGGEAGSALKNGGDWGRISVTAADGFNRKWLGMMGIQAGETILEKNGKWFEPIAPGALVAGSFIHRLHRFAQINKQQPVGFVLQKHLSQRHGDSEKEKGLVSFPIAPSGQRDDLKVIGKNRFTEVAEKTEEKGKWVRFANRIRPGWPCHERSLASFGKNNSRFTMKLLKVVKEQPMGSFGKTAASGDAGDWHIR